MGIFVIAGESQSNDGDVSGNHGESDYWILSLNNTGNIDWQKCFGGTLIDGLTAIKEISNDGFILAGYSNSNDGDVSGNKGNYDAWIVKLSNANGLVDFNEFSLIELFPNPTNDVFNLKSNQNQVGNTFEIFDNSGRVVLSGIINSDNMLIDASKLSNGIICCDTQFANRARRWYESARLYGGVFSGFRTALFSVVRIHECN